MDRLDYRQREGTVIYWGLPSEAAIVRVGERLRSQDRRELAATAGMGAVTPEQWVRESVEASDWPGECHAIQNAHGTPLGLFGVSLAEEHPKIWLLATDGLFATEPNRRQFIRGGKPWVDLCVRRYGSVSNWVFSANVGSIRWLKKLGFTVHEPQPVGAGLQLFSYFERVASHDY